LDQAEFRCKWLRLEDLWDYAEADSDSFRHPIPMDSAMGIRFIPPPPGEGINDAG
jgi:hypothetical protein